MQEESKTQARKLSWSWLTRVLHLLIAVAVVHQLGVSLIMIAPEAGKTGNIYYEFHESVGLVSFGIVSAYWLWLALRRTDRGAGALFPWFSSSGRGAVLADLRVHLISLGRLRLPALEEQPLASAVHGLGLLTATIMAGTGMIAWSGSLSETNAERLWQVHMLVGNLMWAYLIGHVSIAVLHELAGERLLGRMFTLRTKGSSAQSHTSGRTTPMGADQTWIGYKVHLTETCDADRPRLITHVATTLAPIADRDALGSIHADLAAHDLLPDTHLVDAGYVDADLLLASTRDHAVTLLGPSPQDTQWQSRQSGAFRLQDFLIDWDRKIATCPAGHTTTSWSPDHNLGRTVMRIRFSSSDCKPCALKQHCTRSPRRLLTPRRREEHAALEAARAREVDGAFAEQYRWRAGIEGTLSLGVRALHLRRARYLGLAKVHLQHVLTAAALNIGRIADWLAGETVAPTRRSPFARLISQAV